MTNLIATWSFAPFINGARAGSLPNKYDMLVFVYLVDKCREQSKFLGDLTIYTDSLGEHLFNEMGINNINCYDGVFDNVSTKLWAYPKILTYAKQKKPYIHIDLDFIFKRSIELPKCDVLVQSPDNIYLIDQSSVEFETPLEIYNVHRSINAGIVGMFNMELNRRYTDTSLEYFLKNAQYKNATDFTNCVLEQQLLASYSDGYNVSYLSEIPCYKTQDFQHYVAGKKKASKARHYIADDIKPKHYKYLKEIQNVLHSIS